MAESHAWLPLADVLAYLRVAGTSDQAAAVDASRAAAARYVERQRPGLGLEALDPADPADAATLAGKLADVVLGATLLTSRLYARKGTPQGVATFGELGAATIVRSDPDVAMLLGIGRFGRPVAR